VQFPIGRKWAGDMAQEGCFRKRPSFDLRLFTSGW
jgi:hypothetical protein